MPITHPLTKETPAMRLVPTYTPGADYIDRQIEAELAAAQSDTRIDGRIDVDPADGPTGEKIAS